MPSKVRLCNNQTARNVYMFTHSLIWRPSRVADTPPLLDVDTTIMRYFQTELFSSFLPSTYVGHVNLAAKKYWQFMPNWKDGSTVEFIIFRV